MQQIFDFYIALVKVKNINYPLILDIQLLKGIQNFSKCIKKRRSSFLCPITFIAIMYSDLKKINVKFSTEISVLRSPKPQKVVA